MAISSCYNRNAALLFDNAYKDSLRYQSDQLNRGDQALEGESGSKDICKAISEYNTSSAENFTRVHPTDHHTDTSSSSENIMSGSDTSELKNRLEEKEKNSPRVPAGNSWKNLVVKSRALSTSDNELAAPVSKLGDLVDIVRQSQYWGAQKKPSLGG